MLWARRPGTATFTGDESVVAAIRRRPRMLPADSGSQWPVMPDERLALRVVLVDDTDRIRELVAEVVTSAGHEVVGHAHDGWAGVELALAERPDVVITDWQMPRMDGVETARRIRAAYPAVAIVALTTEPMVHDDFLRAGADAVLDKRDMRGLVAALAAVADSRGAYA
jgi:CheY-like chemotaxis protein